LFIFPLRLQYSSATSASEDSKLRQSIRNFAIKESKLLYSIGMAQMEQQIQRKVIAFTKQNQDKMAEETGT
jgi:DNA-binding protein Fis